MKNIYIIGSKGIPAKYGGFETFVEKLTANKVNRKIKYHVACLSNNNDEFSYNEARCFNINVPNIGPAKAVYYDLAALKSCIKHIKKNDIEDATIYILACRIGPFMRYYKRKLKKNGTRLLVNPDGHEWKRGKWNCAIKKYWKISERLMVKYADLLICDSKNIERYIEEDYYCYKPKTTFIAYGADVEKSKLVDEDKKVLDWFYRKDVKKKEYYLIVGRFVPENNYETIITEFLKSKTDKDLVIITNTENNKFFEVLKEKTKFEGDRRIKFVGTVYDQELLKKIRENAYGYFHGHEVGGTNPSLLEALATTNLNILLDVGFNREVADDGAKYFNKDSDNLAKLIDIVEKMPEKDILELGTIAKTRIRDNYSWKKIIKDYENEFI